MSGVFLREFSGRDGYSRGGGDDGDESDAPPRVDEQPDSGDAHDGGLHLQDGDDASVGVTGNEKAVVEVGPVGDERALSAAHATD